MLKLSISLSCLGLIASCGKGIDSSGGSRLAQTDALQSKTVSFKANPDEILIYDIPNDGWATLPEKIHVNSGEADYILTKVSFNALSEEIDINTDSIENIICEYYSLKNHKSDGYTHSLSSCYFYNIGKKHELNYQAGQEIALDKGNYILITVDASDDSKDLEIQSDIDIEWL